MLRALTNSPHKGDSIPPSSANPPERAMVTRADSLAVRTGRLLWLPVRASSDSCQTHPSRPAGAVLTGQLSGGSTSRCSLSSTSTHQRRTPDPAQFMSPLFMSATFFDRHHDERRQDAARLAGWVETMPGVSCWGGQGLSTASSA